MRLLRALLLDHPRLAILALLLALSMKALIPAGYMIVGGDKTLTVTLCSDGTGGSKTVEIKIPGKGGHDIAKDDKAKGNGVCAFSSLSHMAVGGVDAPLLALAFAFILMLGLAPTRNLPFRQVQHLRPPLRGPPATA